MKVASFLRCGVVSVLSLVAVQAGAQIDSNATMKVHCGVVSAGCSMTIKSTFINGDTSSYSEAADFSVGEDYIGRFASQLGSYPPYTLSISIDRVDKSIKLNFHKSELVTMNETSGEDDLDVTFDSLPYLTMPSGGLHIEGMFLASYRFGAFQDITQPHSSGGGLCNSDGQTLDSVSLEITPQSNSSVYPVIESMIGIRAIFSDGKIDCFRFSPSAINRELIIFNMLGESLVQMNITPGVSWVDCSNAFQSPGLCFARLGDQVAKFVVPPR
jgi:hypothetical protein